MSAAEKIRPGGAAAGLEPPAVRWKIRAILFLAWPLAWLPMKLGLALGAGLGRLAFHLMRRRRKLAVDNIEMVKSAGWLPRELNAAAVAAAAFANMGRSGWEVTRLMHRGLTPFEGSWSVIGVEHLHQALARAKAAGRGIILATAHSGNWELDCHVVTRVFGCRLTIVGRSQNSPVYDGLLRRLRTLSGNDFVLKSGGARAMIEALRHGGVLATLVDQAAIVANEGGPITFLGWPAMANLGPFKLARRFGAELLLLLLRREGERQVITILPPLVQSRLADEDTAVLADAQAVNDHIGNFIRQYPDQWLWGHRRWKTHLPDGRVADTPRKL